MWGWLPGCFGLLGLFMGLGRLGGLLSRKAGRPAGALVSCLCGGAGVVGCLVFGVEDTPAAGGLLRPCGCGGRLVVGALARVWGWHAVGVLG